VADRLNDAKLRTNTGNVHSSPVVGFSRARESPRTTVIESLPLGRFGEIERKFASTEQRSDAGKPPREFEAGSGKDGTWGESGRRTRPNTKTVDVVGPIVSDGGSSSLLVRGTGHVRSDRIEGMCNLVLRFFRFVDAFPHHHILDITAGLAWETEGSDLVPGRDVQGGTRVRSKLSSPRSDNWKLGVDDLEFLQTGGGGEPERVEELGFPTPTDPYVDFAFGLDGSTTTTNDDLKRTSEGSVVARFSEPSVLETIRSLESVIGLPTGASTTVDIVPMDFDTVLSGLIPPLPSSGEGEVQCWGRPSQLPFQLSPTSKFPTLAAPSLSSTVVPAFTDLDLISSLEASGSRTPQVSTTVSGCGLTLGFVGSMSETANPDLAEIQGVFSGPNLFLDDDGME